MDCVFCKIVAGEIPSYKVYEDDDVYAFLDISPITKGHTLVIPKECTENIYEIDDVDLQKVVSVTKKLADKYREILKPDGVNLKNNNGKVAGQDVFHYHVHLIPRYKEDGVSLNPSKHQDGVDIEAVHAQLSTAL